jgi:hypothetical protein
MIVAEAIMEGGAGCCNSQSDRVGPFVVDGVLLVVFIGSEFKDESLELP